MTLWLTIRRPRRADKDYLKAQKNPKGNWEKVWFKKLHIIPGLIMPAAHYHTAKKYFSI